MMKRGIGLAEGAVLLLLVTLLGAVYGLFLQEQRASEQIFQRTKQSARVLASFAREAHSQYTTSISSAVGTDKLELSTDLANKPGSVHFPASFSRSLTEKYSRENPNANFSIYSDDPFGTTKDRKLDKFAQEALAAFSNEPDRKEFWYPTDSSIKSDVVRLAVPIVMKENCLACHNSPKWNLNKRNWMVGDVRGVREVSLKVGEESRHSDIEFYALWSSILVSCGLGLFLVLPAVRREVTQRSDMEELNKTLHERANELQVQAITDSLTGLHNRRHFDDLLDAYVEEFGGNGFSISLAFFDLDHFKKINDTFGHDAGDRVIAKFGGILKSFVRDYDFAARIGGEEFAMVIPSISEEDLIARAEALRLSVEELTMDVDGEPIKFTVSVGVAGLEGEESAESLRKRVDAKLYEAKENGRNRVVN